MNVVVRCTTRELSITCVLSSSIFQVVSGTRGRGRLVALVTEDEESPRSAMYTADSDFIYGAYDALFFKSDYARAPRIKSKETGRTRAKVVSKWSWSRDIGPGRLTRNCIHYRRIWTGNVQRRRAIAISGQDRAICVCVRDRAWFRAQTKTEINWKNVTRCCAIAGS